MSGRTASFLAFVLLTGCSAQAALIQVSDASSPPPAGRPFAGIPMRIKTAQTVQIWHLNPDQNAYEKVDETIQVLADEQHLYSVDVVSGAFSSPQLNVTEYPDNTPKSIEVASTENPSAPIDAATTALTGVATTRNGNLTGCASARAAALSADQAVATAQASYDALPASATSQLRAAYQQVITNAQQSASFAHNNPMC
jgi:hypothetical protein